MRNWHYQTERSEQLVMTTTADTPRIYVASLSDYNAGRLHGIWIDATQDADDIAAEITAMLAASPEPWAEEYAIHDYEGFAGIRLGEYESVATVAEIVAGIEEHGPAFAAYFDYHGAECADADSFSEDYCGEWDSLADYAESFAEDCGMVPDNLTWPLSYIDWERAARDLVLGGDIWTADASGGCVYVFRSR